MNHVNKNFFRKNKLFYIICFSFFIIILFTIKYCKEPKEQIEHKINVQSDMKDINISEESETVQPTPNHRLGVGINIEMIKLIQEFRNSNNAITIEKVEVEKVEAKNKSAKKPKKKNKKPKKKNKIYYVQDGNYRYDLPKKYQDYLWSLCKKYKVTDYYKLFIAQMYHESNFDESVISETNDYGLMQINKCNHSWLSKKLKNGDFLDPYNNMEAGVLMMSEFLKKYYDVHKALVCYNRGESAVINGTYSTSYSKCVISDTNKLIEIKQKGEKQ